MAVCPECAGAVAMPMRAGRAGRPSASGSSRSGGTTTSAFASSPSDSSSGREHSPLVRPGSDQRFSRTQVCGALDETRVWFNTGQATTHVKTSHTKTRCRILLLALAALALGCGDHGLLRAEGQSQTRLERFPASYFVGTWLTSVTNTNGTVLRIETLFASDGHFDSTGVIASTTTTQRFQGVWRIDGDFFCTTTTNSAPWKPDALRENRDRLLSVSQNQFSYETKQRIWIWTRKR